MKHSIKTIAILVAILVASCESATSLQATAIPAKVNAMERPVTVLACNEEGVILLGADGESVAYDEDFHFAQMLFREGYKKGDVFLPKPAPKPVTNP